MATPQAQDAAFMSQIANLLTMFTGKSGTQTSTQTEGQQVSPEALAAILKAGLEANMPSLQGGGGQKGAGLYNSTTNSLLQNDLNARLAAEAAKLSTQKTSTQTTTNKQDPGLNAGKTAMGLGGAMLGNTLLKALTGGQDNSVLGKLLSPVLGQVAGAVPKLAMGAFDAANNSMDMAGFQPFSNGAMPTTFADNPIFSGDGLAQAGMGFNDPASWVMPEMGGGAVDWTLPSDSLNPALDFGWSGSDASVGWLPDTGGLDLGSDLGGFDLGGLDPTDWISQNLPDFWSPSESIADSAGAWADATGNSILDANWW